MSFWRQAAATLLIGIAPLALLEGGLRLAGWPTERVRSTTAGSSTRARSANRLPADDEARWRASAGSASRRRSPTSPASRSTSASCARSTTTSRPTAPTASRARSRRRWLRA
jgi:hypothetical protein